MTVTISNTSHISELLKTRGVPVIQGAPVVKVKKEKQPCKYCRLECDTSGKTMHENFCSLNPARSFLPTTKCEKCNFGITKQSLKSHQAFCDGDMAKPVMSALSHERHRYLKALGKNGRLKTMIPDFIVDRFEKELFSRGMPESWGIDEYFHLVTDVPLTVQPEPAIVEAPEPPLLKAAKAMPENSIAEALQELLAEEMGAMRLVKHIDKFMQWQDLTRQLLGTK